MNPITTGIIAASLGLAQFFASTAHAGELQLPKRALARSGDVPVVYRFNQGFTGQVDVRVRWRDSLGRMVEDHRFSTRLVDENRLTFHLDMTRAVAMKNHLRVDLALTGKHVDGSPYNETDSAEADFVARPRDNGWQDYIVIMWQPYPAQRLPALKRLGVDGGQHTGRGTGLPDSLIEHNMRWYSESLASHFYAAYHRWHPDRPPDWSFTQVRKHYRADPGSLAAFKRHPSLWDPVWRQRVHDRGVTTAKRYAPYRPYFYSLSDEPGIADLNAPWDFDFSDQSLAPMRRWLRREYGSLGALNRQWGTHFTDWNAVMPMTTDQAMRRRDDNYSAWADFKTWMDISFADALKLGADAIHEGDPNAYVSIGGAQMPGWGGYDYARLTKVLTAIEPNDIGRNVDIVHSLAPAMPILTTAFSSGLREKHRVWHELLHGNRGLILWDPSHHYASPNTARTSRYLREIDDGAGALIINSRPVNDRIAIHYSQPSMRTQWMRNYRGEGRDWANHLPSYESAHDPFLRLRVAWCDLIEDLGLQPHFVAYDQIEAGALLAHDYPMLVLPHSSALSIAEADAIRAYIAAGGIAIADSVPGIYDEHSRKRAQSPLADLFGTPHQPSLLERLGQAKPDHEFKVQPYGQGKAIRINADIRAYLADRLTGNTGALHGLMENLLRENGIRPRFAVMNKDGHSVVGIDVHVFANGGVRLLSLQSNPQLRVSQLGPPGSKSNARFKKPATVQVQLPRPLYVYDTRTRKALGRKQKLTLTIDPYEPTILALSDRPLPQLRVTLPEHAQRGSTLRMAIHASPTSADVHVFHVEVRNPKSQRVLYYTSNLIAPHGHAVKTLPLAVNETPGRWHITIHDMLSGQTVTRTLEVK